MRSFAVVVGALLTGCMPTFSQSDADSLANMVGDSSVSAMDNNTGGGGGNSCPSNAPLYCSAGWCCPYGQNGRTDVCCNTNPQSTGCTSNGVCAAFTEDQSSFVQQVSSRTYCPSGGRIEVNGMFSGPDTGGGTFSGTIFETLTDCSDGNNTFNGDPYLTATMQITAGTSGITYGVMTFSGGVMSNAGVNVSVRLVLYLATVSSPYNLLSGNIDANGVSYPINRRW